MNFQISNFKHQENSRFQTSNFRSFEIWSLDFEVYLKSVVWILIFCLLLLISNETHTQTTWCKYPGNPIFLPGKPGEWDQNIGNIEVLFEDSIYRMWYAGYQNDVMGDGGLGYATSTDGIHWNKYEGNPLNLSCDGISWDTAIFTMSILHRNSTYEMWYGADPKKFDERGSYIGYASSQDGINWNKLPYPVLIKGKKGDWDALFVGAPDVYFDGNIYHMWYTGASRIIPSYYRIGYATSEDGIHWEKYPGNPVLDVGDPGSWDDQWAGIGSVLVNGSKYELWYTGYNYSQHGIGYATSSDGIHWVKFDQNPIIRAGELGTWDSRMTGVPGVMKNDSDYMMLYVGDNIAAMGIGYATTSSVSARTWLEDTIPMPRKEIRIQIFDRIEFINPDSIAGIINELSGTELVDAYNKLALVYSLNDENKSYYYAEQAFDLANKENYPEGKAMALYCKGNSQYVMDNYAEALSNQLSALHLYDSLEMSYEAANLRMQIASILSFTGSDELASGYYEQSLAIFEDLEATGHILGTLRHLGLTYYELSDTIKARQAFQKMLSISVNSHLVFQKGLALWDLASTYFEKDQDSLIYYLNEAHIIWDTLHWIMSAHNNLFKAEAYYSFGPEYFKEAENHFLKCYETYLFEGREMRIRLLFGMAELYFDQEDYGRAKEYLNPALAMCENFLTKLNYEMYESIETKLEAEVYLKEYMEKIYHLFYRLDTALNNEPAAFSHFMLATQWKDSIYSEQNRRKIAMMQGKYATESSQNNISMLKKENEVKGLKLRQSTIFLFSMGGFLFLVVLMAILFIRQNKIKANHKAVVLEQKLLRLQMNPHFIFNALSNILNLVNRNNNEVASKYLTRFSKLLRNTLEGSRQDSISLDSEINGLENYLELQKLRFGEKFEYEIYVDDAIDKESTLIPPLLVQPFIENAIEHGIKHKKTKGHIFLRFLAEEDQVVCEVEDDGIGREKSWDINYEKRKDHNSLATTIIRERIHNLNKNLKNKIRFKIVDLKSDDNVAVGTKVVIGLPA